MSLIDDSYFRGEINIAQLSQATVRSTLAQFIEKYEPKCLKQVLGLQFAIDFMEQIDPVSGTIEQRWLDLLNGKVYEFQGRSFEWIGFVNDQKESLIANFIYFWWIRKEVQQTTGMGQVKPAGENGTITSSMNTTVRAWNEMVEWSHSLVLFLDANRAVYPEWKPYSMNRFWMIDFYWPFYGINFFRRCNHWPDEFYKINYLNL